MTTVTRASKGFVMITLVLADLAIVAIGLAVGAALALFVVDAVRQMNLPADR